MSEIDNNTEVNDQDVDSLIEQVYAPSNENNQADKPNAEPTPQQQQAIQEYEIKVGGKPIKAPIDKVLQWATMGYDAPNKIGSLQKELENFKQKETEFKSWEEKYGAVDKYVRENPQWFDYVQSQYQKQIEQQNQNPVLEQLTPLQKQVQELMAYKDKVEQEREQRRIAQEDAEYQNTLKDLQKGYPTIDFNSVDESGKSLEYRVLEYANENGIRNFKTAFRDYYFDELNKLSEVSAKEKLVKDKQANSKIGLLGISSTPTTRKSDSVKGKSYDQLAREALEELGINN